MISGGGPGFEPFPQDTLTVTPAESGTQWKEVMAQLSFSSLPPGKACQAAHIFGVFHCTWLIRVPLTDYRRNWKHDFKTQLVGEFCYL